MPNKITTIIARHRTPYYAYSRDILSDTLYALAEATKRDCDFVVHYAIKANDNADVLRFIASHGLGADCVSGGEVRKALRAGFPAKKIVLAGVGKRDDEIRLAIREGIYSLNAESEEEIEVTAKLAREMHAVAPVAIRVNPGVDAHTHEKITTGMEENKFGIALERIPAVAKKILANDNLHFRGLHFHIGSQMLDYMPLRELCQVVQKLVAELAAEGIKCEMIDMGGGLGVDYDDPVSHPVADFEGYFATFRDNFKTPQGSSLHFELGRSIVAQCGSLITRVLFIKKTATKQFAIVDGGFTDLIRPALYGAHHHIDNISSGASERGGEMRYDVVGPICESSDVFEKNCPLPPTRRGDLLAIRSAGAYGEVMASTYNARPLIKGFLA